MDQLDLLREAVRVLEALNVEYMIVGSMASMAYGEPRMTRDVDIVVAMQVKDIDLFCDAFDSPQYYVSREAAREAVRYRRQFNVIHPSSGNKIDVVVARNDAWGQSQLARRKRVAILPNLVADTAAPEDVILGKLWYYQEGEHEKHLRDIASMLRISRAQIDLAYIAHWAKQLGVANIWNTIIEGTDKHT